MYLVVDCCLPDRMRYYHIEDLVEVVSRMLERYEFYPISLRTMQEDLKFILSGEGLKGNLAKRYRGHTKIYTYEAR